MRIAYAYSLLLIALAGCSDSGDDAIAILRDAESFELLSIEPTHGESDAKESETFHGWPILGAVEVTDPADRAALIDALENGILDSDGTVASCFIPRHGIRVKQHGQQHDLVICFECGYALWYSASLDRTLIPLTDSPQPVFNRALVEANIPVAESPFGDEK